MASVGGSPGCVFCASAGTAATLPTHEASASRAGPRRGVQLRMLDATLFLPDSIVSIVLAGELV
jgi:hypothetical protein